MKILFCILILVFSYGCSSLGQLNETSAKYDIQQIDNPESNYMTGGGKVKIEYEDNELMIANAKKSIANEMMPDKSAKELLAGIPLGGHVVVRIFRPTVDTANTKWFTYVVTKNDKELGRMDGKPSVASVPSRFGFDGAFWSNLDIVDITESFNEKDVLKIYVIDKMGGRDEFTIKFKQKEPVK